MIKINPKDLNGKRAKGYALDVHTIQSRRSGTDEFGHLTFDNERSEMGEALYQLKYRQNRAIAKDIAEAVCDFIRTKADEIEPIDYFLPVPPSRARAFQPVLELANIISAALDIPLSNNDLVKTRETPQLKDLIDEDERSNVLADAFEVRSQNLSGKHILLFDDLLGSGATLRTLINILYDVANVRLVTVLVLTHKRKR